METLQNVLSQFQSWPMPRRVLFVATAAGSLAFFLWIAFSASARPYALLYRGLAADEMAEVVRGLDAERIAYRFSEGGTSLEVPADQVYAARIRLAGQGLPRGGGAGFELFDRSDFGVTDFVHRVNYRRALQGELARSIAELEPVSRARVQIAIPERSAFAGAKERQPSASVVVDLRPGAELSEVQVRGIVHLVSAAVESLPAERVSIVDGRGRLLAPLGESLDPAQPGGTGNYQERLESELASRIESILGHTVGSGRVAARVRADLDWTQKESTEERYDPDAQVERSVQRTSETDEDVTPAAASTGIPGVASNLPGAGGGVGASNANGNTRRTSRTSETTEYEISKTVSRSLEAAGTVKRLTVAILLDGKPGAQDGSFEAWDEKSVSQFEELAKHAVGFSAERGDRLTITNAPFRALDAEEEGGPLLGPGGMTLLGSALRGGLLIAALVAFGLLVVRPLATSLASAPSTVLPARVVDLEAQLAGAGGAAAGAGVERVASGAASGPIARDRIDETVSAIRAWLRQG
jgi:flagellar M-ring protein FliF